MARGDADMMAEMPEARLECSGRNPRGCGMGASSVTAARVHSRPEETQMMEMVVERENMVAALRRVEGNKGVAGIDGMTVAELRPYLRAHWPRIKAELLDGRYRPAPVRVVQIPKPGGKGMRMLGIPTVVDRLIQQAVHQVLAPIFDRDFSESSYGFRPGRSALQAVQQARAYVASGRRWVVDMDLERFFDRVNHDVLMARVARKVGDGRVLRLIRRYLQAGAMKGGLSTVRREGTPQGGPLSPLLSNILLDELDKELERRGHAFCRYADDCNVYVRSRRAGQRVLASLDRFLEKRLRLRINWDKSAVDRPWRRTFLGYTMTWHLKPRLRVGAEPIRRLKAKVRAACRRGRGWSLRRLIEELTPILRGWANYFRLAEVKGIFEELDGWVRRRLRCVIWRHWKRPYARARNLMRCGLEEERAWRSAMNGRGPWWNAGAPHMNQAYPKAAFDRMGLVSLLDHLRYIQSAA